ncbi:hypothetical protein [Sphingomonas sp.]|uniref:hypothetical protein n=1 Tax=Sphingomonas sp. TaxID=28214 RepID=UPI00374FE116
MKLTNRVALSAISVSKIVHATIVSARELTSGPINVALLVMRTSGTTANGNWKQCDPASAAVPLRPAR